MSDESTKKLLRVILAALERGALDPLLLDVSKVTSFADSVVLLSGSSNRQVRAVADAIVETVFCWLRFWRYARYVLRRFFTASANWSSITTVVSHETQASVILWPYSRPSGPLPSF